MTLSVLSDGVDSLYLSFAGTLAPELLDRLEELKLEAQASSTPAPVSFADRTATTVLPTGSGFYRYAIHSTDFDVYVARGEHVPPVYVRASSLYLHSVGVNTAAARVDAFVRDCLMTPARPATVSRIDIYADFQGWRPVPDDLDRFVTRSLRHHAYYEPAEEARHGLHLTGFRFGKDQLLARLYDKTREIGQSGKDWMLEVWGSARHLEQPVWRLEYQYRREAIGSFNLATVDEVLACLADLWRYGLDWLSLREPTFDRQRGHWPIADEWRQLRELEMDGPLTGVLRRRWREHEELLVVRGLAGYLSSLAALHGIRDLAHANHLAGVRVAGYLEDRGRSFSKIVAAKQLQDV